MLYSMRFSLLELGSELCKYKAIQVIKLNSTYAI